MKHNFARTSSPEGMQGGAKLFVLSAMLVGILPGCITFMWAVTRPVVIPVRWWSITAYDALSSKLIANEHKPYSFNGDNVQGIEDGSFTLWVSPWPSPLTGFPCRQASLLI